VLDEEIVKPDVAALSCSCRCSYFEEGADLGGLVLGSHLLCRRRDHRNCPDIGSENFIWLSQPLNELPIEDSVVPQALLLR
jgi:hypothetical protein